jgi:hypothetical protein
MSRKIGIAIIVVCSAVLFQRLVGFQLPGPPSPDAPKVVVPQELSAGLQDAFKTEQAAAQVWSGMFEGLGRYIEADGKREKPILQNTFDLMILRDAAVVAPLGAVPGGTSIGKLIGPYMDQIGKSGEPLDEGGRRAKTVELFLGVSQELGAIQ